MPKQPRKQAYNAKEGKSARAMLKSASPYTVSRLTSIPYSTLTHWKLHPKTHIASHLIHTTVARGQHPLLNNKREEKILKWILDMTNSRTPPTTAEIIQKATLLYPAFKQHLTTSWLRRFTQ